MGTKKPIATVSFNTEEHLRRVLDGLVKAGVLSDWLYIKHMAEAEEKKEHFHVWMAPNRIVEKNSIRDAFKEIDVTNPTAKPLGCIAVDNSKIDDWVLYALHDEAYLLSKFVETKKYRYSPDDIVGSSEAFKEQAVRHALEESDWVKERKKIKLICDAIESGQTSQLYKSGVVSLGQANNLRALLWLYREENTRNE